MTAKTQEFAFDVKLMAAIRVKAGSAEEARQLLRDKVEAAFCDFGEWDAGSRIVGEASVDDCELPCFEVDGDENHPACNA